jgi:hypothetical protein
MSDTKWVLPRMSVLTQEFPAFIPLRMRRFLQFRGRLRKAVYRCDEDRGARVDILKISLVEGMERAVLSAVLDTGYRPVSLW